MSKKLVCLVLVVMLLVTSVVFAEGSDGVQIGVTDIMALNGATIGSDFVVNTSEESEIGEALYGIIDDFLKNTGAAVFEFFPQDVQTQVSALMPKGVEATDLVMNEFAPLEVANYDASYGDMKIAIAFDTAYRADKEVVAVVGSNNGGEIEWVALLADANAYGEVEIIFTQDILEAINGGNAGLAILSEE